MQTVHHEGGRSPTGDGLDDIAVPTFCRNGGFFTAESCLAVLINKS
jgi:hypothetical protein